MTAADDPSAPPARGRLREVAVLFARLGFTAFGGPAVHTAMMEDEVVTRRRWLDRQHFLDLVGTLNFIPGPNSTELAIHLGLIRAGLPGLVVAGVCFITPAVLIILPLAWLYVRYAGAGVRPPPTVAGALAGIAAVVVAVMGVATWRFVKAALVNRFTLAVAILTVPADLLLQRYTALQSEIVILAAAAAAGATWSRLNAGTPLGLKLPALAWPTLAMFRPGRLAATLSATGGWAGVGWAGVGGEMLRVFWFFLKVGGTLFGSGYVLVSYLRTGLVGPGKWLTEQQLIDAVAVGQVTPGPLLTTATFIGYVRGHAVTGDDWGGVAGAIVATVGIFLPSFVLVAAFGRVLPALRSKAWARGALDGMNAAVVALLVLVTARLALALQTPAGSPDWPRLGLAAVALAVMVRWNVNSTWLIAAGAVAGVAGAAF